ncbi:MAG: nucleotidyltransferase family protein [Chloroflexi bacterium]|nr:nucleotidyltransferase family protein [Chloroflexota bacterium]
MMISAIILAAGKSKRMGQSKMLLPWGETTVLGQVISVLQSAGLEDVVTVTGGFREQVEELAKRFGLRTVFNPEYDSSEMLSSIQCGLRSLNAEAEAALICLGDQPQVQERSVRMVREAFEQSRSRIVVPSYRMRRGHPWLVARPLWDEILRMKFPQSPRDFLNNHAKEIAYVEIDNTSILEDLDTPEDYLRFKP